MFIYSFANELWNLLQEMAPWLLLGFGISGLINIIAPAELIKKHLADRTFLSIIKSSLVGVPLPLCSCSVIPVAKSLKKNGASNGAVAAFMISTPEIGVDSFLLTKGLLGMPMAIFRSLCAFFTALITGLAVQFLSEEKKVVSDSETPRSCCSNEISKTKSTQNIFVRWLNYSFREMPADIVNSLIVGLVISSLINVLVPGDAIADLHLGLHSQMLISVLISIPTYVCASASTPIAASLLLKGVSPGATIVFLLAGPATNTTTILTARSEFGNRGVLVYVCSLLMCSLTMGYLVEYFLVDLLMISTLKDEHTHLHKGENSVYAGIAIILILFFAKFPIRKK